MVYFFKRVLSSLPTLFLVSLFTFFIIRWIPGDPVMIMLGERGADPEAVAEIKAQLGLDKSLVKQYFFYMKNIFTGELGRSIVSRQPVISEFMSRFPATLELGILALLFSVGFGLTIGVVAALYHNRFWDLFLMGGSLVGYSMPIFWWGLLLILFFSVSLGILPVSGRISVFYDVPSITGFYLVDSFFVEEDKWQTILSSLKHLILPVVVLGTIPLAAIARMTRSSLLEVLKNDFIRTAHSKGLSNLNVILNHGLRNALIPIVTIVGLMFGSILTGAVLTETIFSWPGIGRWLVSSIEARDYPVIQSGVLLVSVAVVFVNICVDSLYYILDPRLKK